MDTRELFQIAEELFDSDNQSRRDASFALVRDLSDDRALATPLADRTLG